MSCGISIDSVVCRPAFRMISSLRWMSARCSARCLPENARAYVRIHETDRRVERWLGRPERYRQQKSLRNTEGLQYRDLDAIGVPIRIRTGVRSVRGCCPRPLDDRDSRENKFYASRTKKANFVLFRIKKKAVRVFRSKFEAADGFQLTGWPVRMPTAGRVRRVRRGCVRAPCRGRSGRA